MTAGPKPVESSDRRVESATFEPTRIGYGRSRVPLATAGWIGVIVALVGVAMAGHGAGSENRVPSRSAPLLAAVAGPMSLPAGESLGDQAIVQALRVTSPAPSGAVISRPQVTVTGRVAVRLDHVVIALEDRGSRILARQSVNVSDAGGFRPAVHPTFEATFDLPEPRPIGALWIIVTGYDAAGTPVDVLRRAILVTAVIEPPLRILDRTDRPA